MHDQKRTAKPLRSGRKEPVVFRPVFVTIGCVIIGKLPAWEMNCDEISDRGNIHLPAR